jgi:hypothetical protein
MAHEFKIMNTSGTIITYTSYDAIPVDSTLKHVISFIPDVGTVVDNREILLETATFNSTATDSLIGVDGTLDSNSLPTEFFVVLDGTDGSSTNAGDSILFEDVDSPDRLVPENFATGSENHLLLEDHDVIILESSTENIDEVVFANVLIGEQSGAGDDREAFIVEQDVPGSDHSHGPVSEPYASTDSHSVSEVREVDLWNYKLSLLIAQENTNNA